MIPGRIRLLVSMRRGNEDMQKHGTHRLFVAIPLNTEFMNVFERHRDAHGQIPYLRWTPLKNLHVTVRFIGDVTDSRERDLVSALDAMRADMHAFLLPFERVQYAPPKRPPRMVWGYFQETPEYATLVERVERAVQEAIPDADTPAKASIPHITLARFRKDVAMPNTLQRIYQPEGAPKYLPVSAVHLMASELQPDAPRYTTRHTFSLQAPHTYETN